MNLSDLSDMVGYIMRIRNIIRLGLLFGLTVGMVLLLGNSYMPQQYPDFLNTTWSEETPLKGGASGAIILKVSDGKNSYVIRKITKSKKSRNDIIREIEAQKAASAGEYGPHLYAYDVDQKIIIMSFLEKSEEKIDSSTKAFKMAELLKKIHNGPLFSEHELMIEQIKKKFLATVDRYPKGIDKEKILSIINEIEKIKLVKKVPVHSDLNPNNIIFVNGEYKVIDFENAGQDDPFFDVATIILYNFSNALDEAEFLQHYFGRTPLREELIHINAMKQAVCIFNGLTHLLRIQPQIISQAGEPIDFYELLDAYNQGKLSMEDKGNVLKVAQSLLKMAIDLEQNELSVAE